MPDFVKIINQLEQRARPSHRRDRSDKGAGSEQAAPGTSAEVDGSIQEEKRGKVSSETKAWSAPQARDGQSRRGEYGRRGCWLVPNKPCSRL